MDKFYGGYSCPPIGIANQTRRERVDRTEPKIDERYNSLISRCYLLQVWITNFSLANLINNCSILPKSFHGFRFLSSVFELRMFYQSPREYAVSARVNLDSVFCIYITRVLTPVLCNRTAIFEG